MPCYYYIKLYKTLRMIRYIQRVFKYPVYLVSRT